MKFERLFWRKKWLLLLTPILTCACNGADSLYPFTLDESQPGSRSRRFEAYAFGQYWQADDFKLHHSPTLAIVGETDRWSPGFGLAYNINNHFAVSGEFSFGYREYFIHDPTYNTFARRQAFVHEGKFDLNYSILPTRFTPFASAGLGYVYFGSDEGPALSISEWRLALNAAGGLRWDFTDHLFIKAYGGVSLASVEDPDWAATVQATFAAGWKF